MHKLGNVSSKLVQLKCITDGGLGAEPPAAGRFLVNFLKKLFNAIGTHFARVQSRLKELDF